MPNACEIERFLHNLFTVLEFAYTQFHEMWEGVKNLTTQHTLTCYYVINYRLCGVARDKCLPCDWYCQPMTLK